MTMPSASAFQASHGTPSGPTHGCGDVFSAVAKYLIPILMKRNEHVPQTAEAKAAGTRDGEGLQEQG